MTSPALLAEIADVLSRPRLRKRVSTEDAQLFLADVAAQVVVFADPADPPRICRDPDDDYLVALALVCGADSQPDPRHWCAGANFRAPLSDARNPRDKQGLRAYRYRDSNPGFRRERAAS